MHASHSLRERGHLAVFVSFLSIRPASCISLLYTNAAICCMCPPSLQVCGHPCCMRRRSLHECIILVACASILYMNATFVTAWVHHWSTHMCPRFWPTGVVADECVTCLLMCLLRGRLPLPSHGNFRLRLLGGRSEMAVYGGPRLPAA